MRKVLREELQITCCAGVATNKLLAKLVSGANKPNQQTVLFQEQVIRFMLTLNNPRQIPGTRKHLIFSSQWWHNSLSFAGVGRKCAERLEKVGVTSVEQLQQVDVTKLNEEFGNETASALKKMSFGEDESPVTKTGPPQVSHKNPSSSKFFF